eukprot:10656640-Alexandrium_andersonii.AAC.1
MNCFIAGILAGKEASKVEADQELNDAIGLLDPSNKRDCEDLLDRVEDDKKEGSALLPIKRPNCPQHKVQRYWTPQEIRSLAPGKCTIRGVYIVHQVSARECCGYYRGALQRSCGRIWGGGRSGNRTEAEAVRLVVQWLWAQHALMGHEPTVESPKPTDAQIRAAVDAMVARRSGVPAKAAGA